MNNRISLDSERGYHIIALLGASVVCGFVLLVLFFVTLSHAVPIPRPIDYVDVNFGTDDDGSGTSQIIKSSTLLESNRTKAEKEKTVPQPVSTPVVKSDKVKAEPVPAGKTTLSKDVSPPVIASRIESPVVEHQRATKSVTPVVVPKNSSQTKKEPILPSAKIDNTTLFKRGSLNPSANTNRASGSIDGANGNSASGPGDKGNPGGRVDSREFFDVSGGTGSGVSLNVSGWGMGTRPQVEDESDEVGKIVFQLKVDDRGEIIAIRAIETTVSASVVDVYKKAVQRVRLIPKSSVTPPVSTGTITFIIKSR